LAAASRVSLEEKAGQTHVSIKARSAYTSAENKISSTRTQRLALVVKVVNHLAARDGRAARHGLGKVLGVDT
jgi:hypothetical protein